MNSKKTKIAKLYWKKNLQYLFILLSVWAITSFGASILWKEWLDQFYFYGFPVGFWFAQQGSIYIFVILIFIYVRLMNKLDDRIDEEFNKSINTK